MSEGLELRMNVAALKRVDPYVKDILETATHVALYTFNAEQNEWEKTDIEGALFVYSRIGEPYNSILIMNRLNTKNQVEPVTPGMDLQLQEPFLLYRNSKCNIYGIWFYDKEECVQIASMLNKILKESENANKTTLVNKKTPQRNTNNIDIFSMLTKAQEDFKTNKSTVGTDSKTLKNNSVEEGALAMPLGPDVTSQSVMDFFAKAKVNTVDKPPPGNVEVTETKPLLQRLMSHPAAHTLEHIEKQQRSITPQPARKRRSKVPQGISYAEQGVTCSETVSITPLKKVGSGGQEFTAAINSTRNNTPKQDYMTMLKSSSTGDQEFPDSIAPVPLPNMSKLDYSTSSTNLGSVHSKLKTSDYAPGLSTNEINTNGPSSFLRIGMSPTSKVSTSMSSQTGCDAVSHNTVPLNSLFAETTNQCIDPSTPRQSTITTSSSAPALIPPVMFSAPSPAEPLNRPLEPLTRNQLLQAFNYLLRSDPDFINKLHEAYVKSFSEILS